MAAFETPATNRYVYNPTGGSWTFSVSAGVQRNGSAWGAPNAPDGVQTAFLQAGLNWGQRDDFPVDLCAVEWHLYRVIPSGVARLSNQPNPDVIQSHIRQHCGGELLAGL